MQPVTTPLNFIDLFCGCGGFTLGLLRAGLRCRAAVDFNPEAIEVFKANFNEPLAPGLEPVPHIRNRDLSDYYPVELQALIGPDPVDVIIGGPPCQGFSGARKVDGANHGERIKEDPRRQLYQHFLRFVKHFKPKVFVIENVLGIRTASDGKYLTLLQKEAREIGYRVHAQIENCVDLGIPQKRRRQLFIGTRKDLPEYFNPEIAPAPRSSGATTLWQAIGDLPPLEAGEGEEDRPYDLKLREIHREQCGDSYLKNVLEIDLARSLTAHRARPHSERDLRDFEKLEEGENCAQALQRKVVFEFPYSTKSFKDRYTRQHRERPCSTIVAHLGKDGLMFIHPTQNRSLTPREAARIQSFPDWFQFPVSRTDQFRVIGNAVPPLVSEAIGLAIKSYLESAMNKPKIIEFDLKPLPKDDKQAVEWIRPLLDLDKRALAKIPLEQFKKAWFSIAFLYQGLHPDGAADTEGKTASDQEDIPEISAMEPRLINPYYEESGWPVVLFPIAKEALRRYEKEELEDDEFYCSEAQIAGACYRNPEIAEEVWENREERERLCA